MVSRFSRVVLTATVAAACSNPDNAPGRVSEATVGPRLSVIDSVQFTEADTAYVGQVMSIGVSSDGSILISDGFARRVLRYSRRGQLDRIYGRAGSGPGEFSSPGLSFLIDDSIVVVDDFTPSTIHLFNARTARPLRQVRHKGYVFSQRTIGDTVWLGAVSMATATGVARWVPATDSIVPIVPVPEVYSTVPALSGTHPIAYVEAWRDTLMVSFSGHHQVYLSRRSGEIVDSLELPAARRRGVPHDLADLFKQNRPAEEYFKASSLLAAVHRNVNGTTTFVHFDQELRGRALTATGFVSLLSADRRTACVDATIPVGEGIAPRVAFAGDTVVVVSQRTAGLRARTIAHWILADSTGCDWVPVVR